MYNVEKHISDSHIVSDSAEKSHELLKSIGSNRSNKPDSFVTRLYAQYSKILSSVKILTR